MIESRQKKRLQTQKVLGKMSACEDETNQDLYTCAQQLHIIEGEDAEGKFIFGAYKWMCRNKIKIHLLLDTEGPTLIA